MADLFISHSHQDVLAARDLRALLEAAGYTCWMAPDDVTGAVPWAEQILNAIDVSKVMIVLLSKAANDSNHVSKEVGLALERNKALLPIRVEDVMPTGSLQYLLQLVQWVDAFPGPMKDHLAQVRRQVAAVVPAPAEVSTAPVAASSASPPAPATSAAPDLAMPQSSAAPAASAAPSVAAAAAASARPDSPTTASAPSVHAQSELVPQPPHSTWSPMTATAPAASPPPAVPSAYGAGALPPPGSGPAGPARPWAGGSSNQRTILASVAIIAVAVVVAAVILGGGKGPVPSPSPAPTTAAVGTPSPAPTPTLALTPTASPSPSPSAAPSSPPSSSPSVPPATPSPTVSPSPPPSGFPNAAEADLLKHVPEAIRSTCRAADASAHLAATADAVVDCYPHTANAPNFVRYASFPTLQAMDGIFNLDVGVAGNRASNGTSCSAKPYTGGLGTYNRNGTTVGQILCYPDGAAAWIEWTYEPDLILVGANRGDGDAKSLYTWWSNLDAAGPL